MDFSKYKEEVENVVGCVLSVRVCSELSVVHPVNPSDEYKRPTVEMFTDVNIPPDVAPELSRVWLGQHVENWFRANTVCKQECGLGRRLSSL